MPLDRSCQFCTLAFRRYLHQFAGLKHFELEVARGEKHVPVHVLVFTRLTNFVSPLKNQNMRRIIVNTFHMSKHVFLKVHVLLFATYSETSQEVII